MGKQAGSHAIGCLITGKRTTMLLIHVVIVLIIVGVLMWLINRFIPMAPAISSILNGVVAIAVVVWLLKAFGLWSQLTNLRV